MADFNSSVSTSTSTVIDITRDPFNSDTTTFTGSSSLIPTSPIPTTAAPPQLSLNLTSTNVSTGRPVAAIAPNLSITDADGGTLPGARVFIDNYNSNQDRLGILGQDANSGNLSIDGANIGWSFDPSTGVLSFNGEANNGVYQEALRRVTYTNTSNTPDTTARNIQFALGNLLSNPENGHFYEFVSSPAVTWTDARNLSSGKNYFGLQGYLATVTSSREQSLIQQKLQRNGWIGASDEGAPNEWRWVTGPEGLQDNNRGLLFWRGLGDGGAVDGRYSNWETGEPNNKAPGESYAHIISDSRAYPDDPNSIGKWNDLPNSFVVPDSPFEPQGYFVEYGGLPGSADLKLSGTVSVSINNQQKAVAGGKNLLWRNLGSGENAVWQLNNATLVDSALFTQLPDQNWKMITAADFNGDGKDDVLWRNDSTGENAIWLMNGFTNLNADGSSQKFLTRVPDVGWKMIDAADFNGDGKADILWRNERNGEDAIWFMDASTTTSDGRYASDEQFFATPIRFIDTNWKMIGAGNFDNDAKADILWRNEVTGENAIWLMDGTSNTPVDSKPNGQKFITSVSGTDWKIDAIGDFDGNGKSDLAWHNRRTGENAVWLVDATRLNGQNFFTDEKFIVDENGTPVVVQDTNWRLETVGDTNGDGKSDLIWRFYGTDANSGINAVWQMNGAVAAASGRQFINRGGTNVLVGDLNWDIIDSYVA
jgi:FG-GAP-like repeat/Lectin C-type domain